MAKYRGKYPTRIKAVWTNRNAPPFGAFFVLNDGRQFRLMAGIGMRLPKLGIDLSDVLDCVVQVGPDGEPKGGTVFLGPDVEAI